MSEQDPLPTKFPALRPPSENPGPCCFVGFIFVGAIIGFAEGTRRAQDQGDPIQQLLTIFAFTAGGALAGIIFGGAANLLGSSGGM